SSYVNNSGPVMGSGGQSLRANMETMSDWSQPACGIGDLCAGNNFRNEAGVATFKLRYDSRTNTLKQQPNEAQLTTGGGESAVSRYYKDVLDNTAEWHANSGTNNAAKSSGDGTTRLWRAVEPNELKDVLRYGDYNIHPNSTFKRFAFDEGSLDAFIKANPSRSYTKTYIDLQSSKLNEMVHHGDPGGVGRAVGIDVFEKPEFYKWFNKVHIKGR
ncbi:hypothetical protein, partial [Chitinivorax sp. B]|uniref:hypothetical protein n=1 Tax=Chitinivorax sp. B TaxID=2502235 RepID=UPI001BB1D74A